MHHYRKVLCKEKNLRTGASPATSFFMKNAKLNVCLTASFFVQLNDINIFYHYMTNIPVTAPVYITSFCSHLTSAKKLMEQKCVSKEGS